jgi:hypothetical protein
MEPIREEYFNGKVEEPMPPTLTELAKTTDANGRAQLFAYAKDTYGVSGYGSFADWLNYVVGFIMAGKL